VTGPLFGTRVIELAGLGPGPATGMALGDLGAEVVRIARPGQPRDLGWPVTMRGRRHVILDLKRAAGREAFLALADQADVVIEPFRPGVAERLGIGPDVCLGRNTRLVYGRMTGWGQEGPWAQTAGHDITYIAVTGALSAIGRAGGPPQIPVNFLGDFGGGSMYLLVGILASLLERQRSGLGQVVDAAVVDGTAHLASYVFGMMARDTWTEARGVNRFDTGAPYYDVYETADHQWMAVGAIEPQFYAELLRLLDLDPEGLPDQDDEWRWPELRSQLAARFTERTREEWSEVFAGSDACVAPVLTWSEARRHSHAAARAAFVERDGVIQPAPAPRLSRTPAVLAAPPGVDGQDTRSVLSDWGIKDVDWLLASGAAVQTGEAPSPLG
jgi:alpha-methylacyl-CoA racemase